MASFEKRTWSVLAYRAMCLEKMLRRIVLATSRHANPRSQVSIPITISYDLMILCGLQKIILDAAT